MIVAEKITGGCQCGAVRYRCESFGRASICHCRMCQKAFGGFYGPLVTAFGLKWMRGEPQFFASSNKVRRGFCGQCGTPLTYDWGGPVEVSIGSLDDPELAPPVIQVMPADKLSFVDGLHALPVRRAGDFDGGEEFVAGLENRQHPDRDTDVWPPERGE
ncbi:GFA family protein [Oricola cellulosilytica]|uniref:GFA family protein n=1 Tax=Oricola cellulosilytica TaxID=1429082 RepID=A0A4R0PDI9_9HYPH|nr:GFA family protein [Oricola cellulosilytica]TCD14275.1 GFA family protein [Oricola cellulosilytica]